VPIALLMQEVPGSNEIVVKGIEVKCEHSLIVEFDKRWLLLQQRE
jgi:hypothetical protein